MQIGAVWKLDKYIEVLQKIQQLSNATRIYDTYPEWIKQVTGGLFWITVALAMGFIVLGMEFGLGNDESDGKWMTRVFVALLVSGGLLLFSISVYVEADKGYKTLNDESSTRVTQIVSNMSESEYNELQQVMQLNARSDTGDVTLNAIAKYLQDKLVRKEVHHHYHNNYYPDYYNYNRK